MVATFNLDDPTDRWIVILYYLLVGVPLLGTVLFFSVENYQESQTPESQYFSQIDEETDIDVGRNRDNLVSLGESACDERLGTRFGRASAVETIAEEVEVHEEVEGGQGLLERRSLTVSEAEVLVDAAAAHLCP